MKHAVDPGIPRPGAHRIRPAPLDGVPGRRPRGGAADPLDFENPGNPYFPTADMMEALATDLGAILAQHPGDASVIAGSLGGLVGLPPQTIVAANGGAELVTWIDRLLITSSVAAPVPSGDRWSEQPLASGKRVDMFALRPGHGFALDVDSFTAFIRARGSRAAIVANPNNPDGGFLPARDMVRLVDSLTDLDVVVVDESFIDFVESDEDPSIAAEAALRPNVLVVRNLGISFGLPGMGLAYAVGNPGLVRLITEALPRWNVNSLNAALVDLLRYHAADYRAAMRRIAVDRQAMTDELRRFPGMVVYPSQANFVLARLPRGTDGAALAEYLLSRHGVSINECGDVLGMTSAFVRLAVRPWDDVRVLVAGLLRYFGLSPVTTVPPPTRPTGPERP